MFGKFVAYLPIWAEDETSMTKNRNDRELEDLDDAALEKILNRRRLLSSYIEA
jgi:hypothetical protein